MEFRFLPAGLMGAFRSLVRPDEPGEPATGPLQPLDQPLRAEAVAVLPEGTDPALIPLIDTFDTEADQIVVLLGASDPTGVQVSSHYDDGQEATIVSLHHPGSAGHKPWQGQIRLVGVRDFDLNDVILRDDDAAKDAD